MTTTNMINYLNSKLKLYIYNKIFVSPANRFLLDISNNFEIGQDIITELISHWKANNKSSTDWKYLISLNDDYDVNDLQIKIYENCDSSLYDDINIISASSINDIYQTYKFLELNKNVVNIILIDNTLAISDFVNMMNITKYSKITLFLYDKRENDEYVKLLKSIISNEDLIYLNTNDKNLDNSDYINLAYDITFLVDNFENSKRDLKFDFYESKKSNYSSIVNAYRRFAERPSCTIDKGLSFMCTEREYYRLFKEKIVILRDKIENFISTKDKNNNLDILKNKIKGLKDTANMFNYTHKLKSLDKVLTLMKLENVVIIDSEISKYKNITSLKQSDIIYQMYNDYIDDENIISASKLSDIPADILANTYNFIYLKLNVNSEKEIKKILAETNAKVYILFNADDEFDRKWYNFIKNKLIKTYYIKYEKINNIVNMFSKKHRSCYI